MPAVSPPFPLGRLNREPIDRIIGSGRPVVRGRIQVPVRTCSVDVFVKLLKPREFAIESVCAWLARAIGLPTPEAFWVTVHHQRMQRFWPFESNDDQLCFGTQALPFAQPVHLGNQDQTVLTRSYGLNALLLAKIALFDELIGNDDRHAGNLLLTPRNTIALIDHERALGSTGLALFSSALPPGPNRLLERVRQLTLVERMELKRPIRDFCASCASAVYRAPYAELVRVEGLQDSMQRYLESRAERLAQTAEDALGIPDFPGFGIHDFRPSAL